jgi:hypothetical protein
MIKSPHQHPHCFVLLAQNNEDGGINIIKNDKDEVKNLKY